MHVILNMVNAMSLIFVNFFFELCDYVGNITCILFVLCLPYSCFLFVKKIAALQKYV